jgi:phosphate transport system substrate-binding protein
MHAFSKVVIACLAASALVLPLPALAQSQMTVNGAGATFPFPLIDTWRVEYKKVNPNFDLNYQSIGSGGGIKQFTEKTVDFGASDAPLSQNQTSALSAPAVHIPETIGSVVAAYNIPGINQKGLKLTGPILADIYLGKITMWDDPAIKSLNPDLPLPSKSISVVRRSDGSGTTFVWTSYLSLMSPEWKDKVGKGTAVQWPVGRGAPGNEGVATTIKGASYSIGYVELAYALTTGMNYAFIQNQAGNFIEPTLESTQAAVAASAGNLPKGNESWANVAMLNASGDKSYPIASFSYLLLYQEMSTSPKIDSPEKAKAIVDFISWAISPAGQAFAQKLSYVPLPDAVVKLNQQTLALLTYKGQPVLAQQQPQPQPKPEPQPQPQGQFSASAQLNGQTYTVTGSSATAKAMSASINEGKSVEVKFAGAGDVQLTLPKSMIGSITAVTAGGQDIQFKQVSSTDKDTTISFAVPQDATVQVTGTQVVPEFGLVAATVMAVSLAAVIGLARTRAHLW